jgi:hypothetical protein
MGVMYILLLFLEASKGENNKRSTDLTLSLMG